MYYKHHIFFCLNQRDKPGEESCAPHDAQAAFDHCKSRVKKQQLAGPGGVRVNKAGCLDRCAGGPVAVVYPDAVWYTYVDKSDIDEIVESHLKHGQVVERLLLPPTWGADRRRTMNANTVRQRMPGPAGEIECAIDAPASGARGVAVVCHPHPQQGGTLDNKVVQTLSRAFLQLGYKSVRFNFRGVGASQGDWAGGVGEIDDASAVIAVHRVPGEPFLLAGFSFGGYVAAAARARLADDAKPDRLVLVGPSTERQQVPPVPADSVVIHGETDDIVPLAATLAWARPQSLPVIVFPGVGHFFHGQLALLKTTVVQALQGRAAG